MSRSDAGKTDRRRPCLIPRWLQDLRWGYAYGHINKEQYDAVIKEHENENSGTD